MTAPDLIPHALDAFIRGFSFTRSQTHPYVPEQIGPAWVLRDAPRRSGKYRSEEWVSHEVEPAALDALVRTHSRGRFRLCPFLREEESFEEFRDKFKALGYRLNGTEALMVHRLARIPRVLSPVRIERVTTPALTETLAKATRSRRLPADFLRNDSPLRQYVALTEGEPVGWAQSVAAGESTWCNHMYVRPEFRRRGIARALLSRLLRDDREAGAKRAVLLASHTGAKLYPVVGYERLGTLLIFTPRA